MNYSDCTSVTFWKEADLSLISLPVDKQLLAMLGDSMIPPSECKITSWKFLICLDCKILIYPISSLADKGTWPQRSTWQAQSASLRTLIGDCWLIQKPWRSCLPSGSLLWWWLSWGSTAQANPTWWTGWLGRTRVSGPSRAQPSLSVHPHPQHVVMWREEVRDLGGILKANFQSTVMLLSSLRPERISSPLFALCLSFFFKSISCSFPRKTNVVIKNR